MMIINNNTTWSELKLQPGVNQDIAFETPPAVTLFKKVTGFFTGSTPVTDKMYSLIQTRIKDYLVEKSKKSDHHEELVEAITQQVLNECSVNYRDLNQTDAIAKIFRKIEENIIKCFQTQLPKIDTASDPENSLREQAAMCIAYLMGGSFDTQKVTWPLIKAVLFQANPDFRNAFRSILEEISQKICLMIAAGDVAEDKQRIYEILIGNILSLIAFSEPEQGSTLQLPQKIHGKWHLVDYKVEVLPLNPDWLGGTMPAFGLTPKESAPDDALRLLLFRGTAQPTGSGFLCTLLADSIPGHSVGEFIYNNFSKETIAAWINKDSEYSKKVKIYGTSLGGAFAWHTQQDHSEQVEEVNIYGSPTPFGVTTASSGGESPLVNAYVNYGDPIPNAGMGAPSHWNVYMLFVEAARPFVFAHPAMYSAFSDVVVMKIDPQVDKTSTIRKIINVVHHILILFTLPVIITLIALRALTCFIIHTAAEIRAKIQQ